MNLLAFTNALSRLQITDRPKTETASRGLCIATIYGFAGREHMQRNLLRFLRESGYTNTTMYGHLQAKIIADDLQAAAARGERIVVIGYSQGGLESVRVAHELNRRGISIALLVTIARGGCGVRLFPHRWADDPRTVPANVERCLNYFSASDVWGTDHPFKNNLAVAVSEKQHAENIAFTKSERVSHMVIAKCYPTSKVHPRVNAELLQRIKAELAAMCD